MADLYLWSVPSDANTADVRLRDPTAFGSGGFPTQYAGLRTYFHAAVQELCLVAEADAPTGMGGVVKISKGGVSYAVYLVETVDALATPVRIETTVGTKAVRYKT